MGTGVPPVAERIVVHPDAGDLAAGRQMQRLGQFVVDLPVEVELGDVEDRLFPPVGPGHHPPQALAPQVHVGREAVQRDGLADRGDAGDLPVVGVGRNVRDLPAADPAGLGVADRLHLFALHDVDVGAEGVGRERVAGLPRQHLVGDGHGVEPDAELAALDRLDPDGVVVHGPADPLVGGEPLAGPRTVPLDAAAGHVGQQLARPGQVDFVEDLLRDPALRPGPGLGSRRLGQRRPQQRVAVEVVQHAVDDLGAPGEVDGVGARVMDDPVVARPQLEDLGEPVLVPRHLGVEVDVVLFALGRHRVLDGQLEHVVGLAPLVGPFRREVGLRGEVGVVPPGRAGVDPRREGVDVALIEVPLVPELHAVARVCRPRRHLARDHDVLDGPGPGTDFGVLDQGHRRDVVRPVAGHAVLVEDRRHVAGERRGRSGPRPRLARRRRPADDHARERRRCECPHRPLLSSAIRTSRSPRNP